MVRRVFWAADTRPTACRRLVLAHAALHARVGLGELVAFEAGAAGFVARVVESHKSVVAGAVCDIAGACD